MTTEDILDALENTDGLASAIQQVEFENVCYKLRFDPLALTAEQRILVELFIVNQRELMGVGDAS